MKISPARKAAFDILYRIEADRAYSSYLLGLYEPELSRQDRGLCHAIVLGVLRRQLYLDRITDVLSGGKKIDPAIRIAIRIGLFQLFELDRIPDHSAINESVELAVYAKKRSAKPFVNAVLRRAVRQRPDITYADEIDRISIETSHPRWLIETWSEQFGRLEAELIAKANNEPAPITFRRTAAGTDADLSGFRTSSFVNGCFFADGLTTELSELADAGKIYFQSEGSQMVAAMVDTNSSMLLLDVCAAPGSKVTQIAARGKLAPDQIVAGEFYGQRAEFMRKSAEKQAVSIDVIQHDAMHDLPYASESFDIVMVDAPCSGTGTIRRNPEIRYLLDPGDPEKLSLKQLRMLCNASKCVKTGGSLIYSTCSLESVENESVCRRFLENAPFKPVDLRADPSLITGLGAVRTFPSRDKLDGFFIAGFQRSS